MPANAAPGNVFEKQCGRDQDTGAAGRLGSFRHAGARELMLRARALKKQFNRSEPALEDHDFRRAISWARNCSRSKPPSLPRTIQPGNGARANLS